MTERSGSDKVQNGMGAPVAARSLLSRWKDVRGAAEVDGGARDRRSKSRGLTCCCSGGAFEVDVGGAAEVDGSAEVVGCAEDLASPAARSVEIG